MSIGRDIRERWLDRDRHFEIRQENNDIINQILYLRGIESQKKNRHEHNREALRGSKTD